LIIKITKFHFNTAKTKLEAFIKVRNNERKKQIISDYKIVSSKIYERIVT